MKETILLAKPNGFSLTKTMMDRNTPTTREYPSAESAVQQAVHAMDTEPACSAW
jgi:hypothetical protein